MAAIGEFGPPVLFVEDLARSKDFYVERLGFALGFEDATSAGVFLGEEFLILVTIDSANDMLPGQALGPPLTVPQDYSISSSRTWTRRSKTSSREGSSSSSNRRIANGGATAHLRDPDGVIWEISQSIQ